MEETNKIGSKPNFIQKIGYGISHTSKKVFHLIDEFLAREPVG